MTTSAPSRLTGGQIYPALSEKGFTLLELLVTVAIVGVLAAIAIPQFADYRERAQIRATATELRGFATAFMAYYTSELDYPPDNHLEVPDGMDNLLPDAWMEETPIGGRYNWDGPDFYGYAGVALSERDNTDELIPLLDSALDDGNTATGRFRITPNGRATFIIEE